MTSDTAPFGHTDTREEAYLRWRERRIKELAAPDSWLGLVGLHWLEPGSNPVGRAPGSAVPLPEGPAHLGDLVVADGAVHWRPAPGSTAAIEDADSGPGGSALLATDRDGSPSRVRAGDLAFFVIDREGRLAARVRDLAWQRKRPFAGVGHFPFTSEWRIEAAWEAVSPPLELAVPDVSGELKTVTVARRAVFRVNGADHALLPLEESGEGILFVFRDATSGKETYGGGRFLRAVSLANGHLTLDFNRAFNPPCAFTPFATCPLPPPENWLPFAVRAGETKYAGT